MKCWKLHIRVRVRYVECTPVHPGPVLLPCPVGITMQKNSISKQTNALYLWQCTASHKIIKGHHLSSLLMQLNIQKYRTENDREKYCGKCPKYSVRSFLFWAFCFLNSNGIIPRQSPLWVSILVSHCPDVVLVGYHSVLSQSPTLPTRTERTVRLKDC